MLQTMRSAHTCLPRRSSIGAHEIWRHCDFTRVLTKSQIHVIDRRRCQRAGPAGLKDIFVLLFGCARQYCTRDDPSRAGARHTDSDLGAQTTPPHAYTHIHLRSKRKTSCYFTKKRKKHLLSFCFKKYRTQTCGPWRNWSKSNFFASLILNFEESNFSPRPLSVFFLSPRD